MRFLAVLISFLILLTSPVYAETGACQNTISTEFLSKYVLPDYNAVVGNRLVNQTELTTTCGHSTYGLWVSTDLGRTTSWGEHHGDEIDFEYFYTNEATTPIGKITYQFSADYYVLARFNRI